MNSEILQPVSPETPAYSVPWRSSDNWIGIGMLVVIEVVVFVITQYIPRTDLAQSAAIVLLELAFLLPVVLILAWRHINWKVLGFGKFEWSTLGLGCGLLVGAYLIIMLHNLLLYFLGVETQGMEIVKMFARLNSPVWFFIVGTLAAPFVEEIFFRGFLFQGFRQRYGWIKAMLLSSIIFGIAHLDLAALIPASLLGCVLAYMYHRSNSVWPGIILHFLVNAFGLCGAYFAAHYQNLMPL